MTALEYAQKANDVFVLSDSFVRIKELIDDETSTIDDIAEVIMIDPALASTILKLANSSFFNYPGKIDTISKALLVLGITEVYNLVIAYFTSDAFKAIDADADYLERYWEASVDAALLIKYLGEVCKVPNAERMFILGLLCKWLFVCVFFKIQNKMTNIKFAVRGKTKIFSDLRIVGRFRIFLDDVFYF